MNDGEGEFWVDTSCFSFRKNTLLFFSPYQQVRFDTNSDVQMDCVHFHANFLCIETFHAEAGCAGILFNDPAGIPFVSLSSSQGKELKGLIDRIVAEQQGQAHAHEEVMLALLKIVLVKATRIKRDTTAAENSSAVPRHPVLMEFRELVNQHYQSIHTPAEYARLLHITPKNLGRIVREQLGTTPTQLIRNRILTHTKWQLLHTLRSVKEIAREVGFRDELYFSRLFKKATGVSPTFFREFETEIRGGRNLSMVSSPPSIQSDRPLTQNAP